MKSDLSQPAVMARSTDRMRHNQPPSIPPCQGGSTSPATSDRQKGCLEASPDKGRFGGVISGFAFLPYNKTLTIRARENRKNPTKAESKMWNEVFRMRQFAEYKFLRQKPIDNYIVDFYCSNLRLVIEIDGESHAETVEYDSERTKVLEALGLAVIRYSNDEVLNNIQGVWEDLRGRIAGISGNQPPSIPPCQGGR